MKKIIPLIIFLLFISIISGACSKDDAFNENENFVDTLVVADTTVNKDTIFKNDTTIFDNDTIIITDTIINKDTIITQDTLIVNKQDKFSEVTLADPYILSDGKYYYAYGTTAASKGFEVYRSRELYKWEKIGFVLLKENTTANSRFWAPEVYKIDDTYYMFYAADAKVYIATSSSPEGPFVQLGKSFICHGIDPHLYQENGKRYLFYVPYVKGKNEIWMAELNENFSLKQETAHRCLTPEGWEGITNEGPFIVKHNNTYHLTYSGSGYQNKNYAVCVATADSITGTWTKAEKTVLQKPNNLYGTGHHSLFIDKNGEQRIVFHAHNDFSSVQPRRMYIGKYYFDDSGIFAVEKEHFIAPKLKTK